jgi:hypothetical protein
MATKTLNALTYQKAIVTDALGDTFIINPFDSNGNLVEEMYIEVESSLAVASVYLPPINSLNRLWNLKITIVAQTGSTNNVDVYGSINMTFDTIGSQPKIALVSDGGNALLNIVSDTIWSATSTF